MQPYINPYLFQSPCFSNFGNNTTPSIQNVPSFSSYQAQQLGIAGKYVNDFSEITANDVPMNGMPAVFAKNDRSEIQLREWNPNGQIVTTLYKPYVESEQETQQTQPLFNIKTEVVDPIFGRISELEDKIDKLSKPVTASKGVTK